ncbi:bacillithiol biosynthesis deacetylase BshB2 [Alicyclobacillus tolerans]|uniref:bacillithiol biosynthesis deacetylase BshB2 n=1 Tax=Alicyclobacillus tolerans TaxID=90970 RepID=UPI003B78B1EE
MERVMVVLPHPDDETFGCGGTIAKFAKEGAQILYMCGTLGEMGRNMGKPFFATRETLPDVRARELEEACAVLGIQEIQKMGLRDKTVEFEDAHELANRIRQEMIRFKPQLLITHFPKYGVHPDHDALGYAAILAVKMLPKDERPLIYAHAITHNRMQTLGKPDVEIEIADVLETKVAAIRAHRSQSEAMMKRWSENTEPDEAWKKRMDQMMKKEVFWLYDADRLPETLW